MGNWAADAAELDRRLGRTPPAPTPVVEAAVEVVSEPTGVGESVATENPVGCSWSAVYGQSRAAAGFAPVSEGTTGVAPMIQPAMLRHGVVRDSWDGWTPPRAPYPWGEVAGDWWREHILNAHADGGGNRLFSREMIDRLTAPPPDPLPPDHITVKSFTHDSVTVEQGGAEFTYHESAILAAVGRRELARDPEFLKPVLHRDVVYRAYYLKTLMHRAHRQLMMRSVREPETVSVSGSTAFGFVVQHRAAEPTGRQ